MGKVRPYIIQAKRANQIVKFAKYISIHQLFVLSYFTFSGVISPFPFFSNQKRDFDDFEKHQNHTSYYENSESHCVRNTKRTPSQNISK